MGLQGRCDTHEYDRVTGWAFDSDNPSKRCQIVVIVDDVVVHSFEASASRQDLVAAGLGDGYHGFDERLPLDKLPVPRAKIRLGIAETDYILERGELIVDSSDVSLTQLTARGLSAADVERRLGVSRERAHSQIVSASGEPIPQDRKVVIYAINASTVSPTHEATLSALKAAGYFVVLINSHGVRLPSFEALVGGVVDRLVFKQDQGRDVASWLTVIMATPDILDRASHILFANDSLIGPVCDIQAALAHYGASGADFWALSDSYQNGYHLQSSFFILSANGLRSSGFSLFLASYGYPSAKDRIIREGEIGLSSFLLKDGIKTAVLCPYEAAADKWLAVNGDRVRRFVEDRRDGQGVLDGRLGHIVQNEICWTASRVEAVKLREPLNPQHFFWDVMIREFEYPFIKRELVCFNPESIPGLSDLYQVVPPPYRLGVKSQILHELRQTSNKTPPMDIG